MRDTVIVEDCKKPAVVALTEEFVEHGKNIARMSGHGDLRQLVFPFPLEGLPAAEIERIAKELYPKLLATIGVTK